MAGFYPCEGCVVLPCCTTFCEKVSKKRTEIIRKSLEESICPDCGGVKWTLCIEQRSFASVFICEGCNHKFLSYGKRYEK
jgi:predicted RNA-binding Zn-ribbon protein involved in translation (DUF1610 family)